MQGFKAYSSKASSASSEIFLDLTGQQSSCSQALLPPAEGYYAAINLLNWLGVSHELSQQSFRDIGYILAERLRVLGSDDLQTG